MEGAVPVFFDFFCLFHVDFGCSRKSGHNLKLSTKNEKLQTEHLTIRVNDLDWKPTCSAFGTRIP